MSNLYYCQKLSTRVRRIPTWEYTNPSKLAIFGTEKFGTANLETASLEPTFSTNKSFWDLTVSNFVKSRIILYS